MSFINLMGADVWSDHDIVNRTEAELAAQFPRIAILQRKVTGQMLGAYTLTEEEQAELSAYQLASFAAGEEADAARADMARLAAAMAVERGEVLYSDAPADVQLLVDERYDFHNSDDAA